MDIGSLTGQIALEDQLTDKLKLGIEQIKEFGKRFEGMTGGVLVGAGAIAAAVTGAVISIVSLGEKGSTILGVEDAFNRLAEAAGTTGDALIGGLTQGVRGTIDSMELMQSTTRLLSSGMKLTEADMRLMGATAREMGKATGTNAAQGLNTLSQALLTGNTRSLKRYGINIDLVKSEEAFADSIGKTRDQLNDAGRLEAHRIAMLEGMREKLNRLGESQLSFKERVQQATVTVGDWFDSLAKGVAGLASVNRAFDTIATGISKILGGTSQTVLQTILSGVDKFANVITSITPRVVQAIDTIKNKIIDIWNWLVDFNERWQITNNLIAGARAAWGILQQAFGLVQTAVMAVIDAWRSMPDWLQRITKTALEGALATGIYAAAIKSTAAPIGALISGVDLSINIIGNLTGAVYNVVNLIKPFTAYIANLSLAFANFRVAVLALTASMGINAVITRSLALGHTFLLESLVKTINVIGSFNRALGVTAVVNAAASASAGVLSAAKLFLGRVVLAVSINYNVLLARIGLTTAAMAASSVTAGIATVAMTALGVALTAVQYVLIPVALAWGAWKFGEWLGSFPRVQRAIIWLAENLHLISTEAANAKRAMLDMNDAFPKGTPAGGYFSIDPAVASIQKTVLELGQRLGKTGDELDQFVDDAVRRFRELKDNGGTDVQILTAQLKSLNVWETDTSVFKKLAEDALRLQASGAVLSPALLDLIARFGDVKTSATGAGQGVESFTKNVDVVGEKVTSLLKSYREAGTDITAFTAAFGKLTPAQKENFTVQQMLVGEMDKMLAAHKPLTAEMTRVYNATIQAKQANLDRDRVLLESSDLTAESVERMKQLGKSESDIAFAYGVSTQALTLRLTALQKSAAREEALAAFNHALVEQEAADRARKEAVAVASNKAIADSQKELDDLIRQQTMTTTDYQIMKIQEEEAARVAAFSLTGASAAAVKDYADLQKRLSKERVDALTVDATKLVSLSKTSLEQIRDKEWNTYKAMKAAPEEYSEAAIKAQKKIAEQASISAEITRSKWAKAWDGLKASLHDVLLSIPQTIANAFTGGGGMTGAVKSIASGVGAAIGGAVGSAFGPLGTAIGSALGSMAGSLVDPIKKLFGIGPTAYEKRVRAAAEETKKLQAETLELYGGMSNLTEIASRVGIDIKEAFSWKDPKAFGTVLDDLKVKLQKLEEGIRGFGAGAATRIDAFISPISGFLDKIDAANKKVDESESAVIDLENLRANMAANGSKEWEKYQDAVKAYHDAVTEASAITERAKTEMLNTLGGTTEEVQIEFSKMGLYAGTAFAQNLREHGLMQALRDSSTMFDQLIQVQEVFGFEMEGASAQFFNFYKIAKENSDVVQALDGITQMIIGAGDAMFLNQELMTAFGEDAVAQYTRLTERGVESNQALALMQPTLQALWEAQQKFGLVTDDSTQALIDQARKQGIVGEAMRSVNQQILDVLKGIARVFGVDIPDASKSAADAVVDNVGGAIDNLNKRKISIPIDFPIGGEAPEAEEATPMSGGGRVIAFTPRGTDTVPAMLTPGEIVTPAGRSQTPVIIPITLKTRNNEVIAKEVVKTFVVGGL